MTLTMTRVLTMSLCTAAAMAHAADTPASAAQPAPKTTTVVVGPGTEVLLPGLGPGLAVKNTPYSGDIVKERMQILGDGNQIFKRTLSRVYRDSTGRTREENLDENGDAGMVFIMDPNLGVQWFISPASRSATRTVLPGYHQDRTIKVPHDGRMHVIERRIASNGTEQTVFKPLPRTDGKEGEPTTAGRYTIRLPNPATAAARAAPLPLDPIIAGTLSDRKWAAKPARRDLGTREIDGIKAIGQLRTYEIPAGELGNRYPIVVSDETWYAPALSITLATKHSDPRVGDSSFRIDNLKRDEPAASLFAPPADYTVREIPTFGQRPVVKPAR